MKVIKVGRKGRRVVFENSLENWDWLERKAHHPINKPYLVVAKSANEMNEDDAFLFFRQYFKYVCGYADDRAICHALFQLWEYDANRSFEQHLLHHGLISEDAKTLIEGDLICEHVAKSEGGLVPTCFARTYYRKDGKYGCSTVEWAVMDGAAFDWHMRISANLGMQYGSNEIRSDVEPEDILDAIKWRKNLVWFEKDIKMIQLDCLFSKQ